MTYDNEYEDTSDEPTAIEPVTNAVKSRPERAMRTSLQLREVEPVKPAQKYMGHLPFEVAKAMKPIIMGKHAGGQPSLTQIYCEAIDDERKDKYSKLGRARYIATNGAVMLTIETTMAAPTEPVVFSAEPNPDKYVGNDSDVSIVIASKGHVAVSGEDAASAYNKFPDVSVLRLDGEAAVTRAGFNAGYLHMLQGINTALKLGRDCNWSVRFTGNDCDPTVWEPSDKASDTGHVRSGLDSITSVQFVIMPVRLD